MNIKRIKRKCSVRGCKNTDTFALSLTREMGNSVIMCKSCAEAAAKAMNDYVPEEKKQTITTAPPPLFYHGEVKKESPVNVTNEDIAVTEQNDKQTEFVCPVCGKIYKTEAGLEKHMEIHKEDKR